MFFHKCSRDMHIRFRLVHYLYGVYPFHFVTENEIILSNTPPVFPHTEYIEMKTKIVFSVYRPIVMERVKQARQNNVH